VFAVQLGGRDGAPAGGATSSYLGRWESVEITLKNDWVPVTSSDAYGPEKRKKMQDFSGSLKGWIDTGGSQQLLAYLQSDLIIITFTNTNDGKTMICRAGISKASATWGMDHGKDTLDFEDVGSTNFGGASVLTYA
jgi:hypothetical protein